MHRRKARLKPLKQWICDHCARVIKRPEDGWVEWLTDSENGRYRGFRIVHHRASSPLRPDGSCDVYPSHPDRPKVRAVLDEKYLTSFTDGGAIAQLLSFLDPEPHDRPAYAGPRVADIREWVHLTRRLTVPYYEEARFYLPRAAADGVLRGWLSAEICYPENLRKLIE